MKTKASQFSPDFLTAELQSRGLLYLAGPLPAPPVSQLKEEVLLAELARQQDARLRSALIPLFLQQPHFAGVLPIALNQLNPKEQMTLKTYYTAAVILQDEFERALREYIPNWHPLPDLYSTELGVKQKVDIATRLRQLSDFHTQLTGLTINWPGTYRHAAESLIHRLQQEVRWAA